MILCIEQSPPKNEVISCTICKTSGPCTYKKKKGPTWVSQGLAFNTHMNFIFQLTRMNTLKAVKILG